MNKGLSIIRENFIECRFGVGYIELFIDKRKGSPEVSSASKRTKPHFQKVVKSQHFSKPLISLQ